MTPNKLKMGDKQIINGKSCNDLGIGDIKIKTMINDFNDIKDKKNVVTNPIDGSKANEEMDPIFTKYFFSKFGKKAVYYFRLLVYPLKIHMD